MVFFERTSLSNVKIGMQLALPVYDDWGTLLYPAKAVIETIDQIENLKRNYVFEVACEAGVLVQVESDETKMEKRPQKQLTTEERFNNFLEQREEAKMIQKEAFHVAKDLFTDARGGKLTSVQPMRRTVEKMLDSLIANPEAVTSLSLLKNFDDYTFQHSVNVCVLSLSLAHSFGFPRKLLSLVGFGAILHDIGKMRIPESILNKPGRYSDWEFNIMKKHPLLGAEMLRESGTIEKGAILIASQHHERADGRGYPQGLHQGEISELARLVAITDVYDALTTKRVYKETIPPHKALAMIFENRNHDFDSELVERFTKTIGIFPIGSYVKLSNGQKAIVVSINHQNTVFPSVLIIKGNDNNVLKQAVLLDLASEEARSIRLSIVGILNPEDEKINVEDYLH